MKPKPLSAFDKNDPKKPLLFTGSGGGGAENETHEQKRNFLSYLRSKLDPPQPTSDKRCFSIHKFFFVNFIIENVFCKSAYTTACMCVTQTVCAHFKALKLCLRDKTAKVSRLTAVTFWLCTCFTCN